MKLKIIDFICGTCIIRVKGVFCERIINIANSEGIFIQNIFRIDENTITFAVSRQGARHLLSRPLPPDISAEIIKSNGLPEIFSRMISEPVFLIAPFLTALLLFFSTQIVWHVNIIDAPKEKEEFLLEKLKELGVKKGALKFTIDQSYVKNQMLIQNPTLSWIWVDIRGGSAIVKYADRIMPPEVFQKSEFFNLYSGKDAVITKIITTSGIAKVQVGDTVLKGQILIEGTAPSGVDTTENIHASGQVFGNVWEERCVYINKKEEIRTPTGLKTEHLSIKFTNFQLNFFINSSILYPKYDIIENNRVFSPLNITFNKKEYVEVEVSYRDNNLEELQKKHREEFCSYLDSCGFTIKDTESYITDEGDRVLFTVRVLCEEPIAKERRMDVGENNSSADS